MYRNEIKLSGQGESAVVLVHGFGCDQSVWGRIIPPLAGHYRVATYDLTGSGLSEPAAYDYQRYSSLEAHAADLLQVCSTVSPAPLTVIGHSIGGTIAMLAANRAPHRFSSLVMIGSSPRYLDDDGYVGGFSKADIDQILELQEANFETWARAAAPALMDAPERPALARELADSLCRNDPRIARHFAKVTFLSDHRSDAAKNITPTLILQSDADRVAPVEVGEWLHRHMTRSTLVTLRSAGHFLPVSAPEATSRAILDFLAP